MLSDLWNKVRELVSKMLPKKSVEEVLHITPMISDRMADAIQLWSDMYEGNSPWLRTPTPDNPVRIVSLGLPALIASEKARMVTLEMKTEISAPMEEKPIDGLKSAVQNDTVSSNQNTESAPAVGSDNKNTVTGGKDTNTISTYTAYQQKTEMVPTGPTERAEFLNEQYKKLVKQIRRQLEYGVAKGGLVIKPYIVMYNDGTSENALGDAPGASNSQTTNYTHNNTNERQRDDTQSNRLQYSKNISRAEIEFDYVQADRFFPLSFDANGKVIEAAFIQTKVDKAKERVYIRLEYHKLNNRTVTVENLAFESTDMSLANSNNIRSATHLGKQIPLTAVPEWSSLRPKTVIDGVDRLLFAYFRMPEANTVDPYSPLGVSGYSRVIQLIKDADMQYSRLLWEFEGGEMAIDVDRDALKFVTDPNGEGRSVLPEKQERLFSKVDLNAEDTYNVFAPPLRDASIVHGLNTIFMRIEDSIGLSRGTLSDVTEQEAKTATELKIMKQRSYATNADIQAALQDALEDTIYVMDVYCTLYDVTPPGEYEASFEWDDSIIIDSESELSKRLTLMQNGLASKLETRMWYYGETENQARAALMQVERESVQAMMQNAQAEIMKSQSMGKSVDDTESPGDTTSDKVSKGKQADNLENPTKNQNKVDNS